MKLVNRKSKNKNTVVLTSFKRINTRDFSLCHGNYINVYKEIVLCDIKDIFYHHLLTLDMILAYIYIIYSSVLSTFIGLNLLTSINFLIVSNSKSWSGPIGNSNSFFLSASDISFTLKYPSK